MPRGFYRMRSVIAAFGKRVRAHRLELEMTQVELGRVAGVTAKFIGEVERGTGNPSLETMAILAQALGCDLAYLVGQLSAPIVPIRARDLQRARKALAVAISALTKS